MSKAPVAILGTFFLTAVLAAPNVIHAQANAATTPATPLATQELDVEGVVAEVIESARKDGVLSVRVRFRNNGSAPAKLKLVDAQGYVHTYVVSGDMKYPLLEDDTGKQVATPRDGGGWLEPTVSPKSTWSWWGKFPAPPAARKDYTLYLKVGPPIDNIPIVDKP